jgi:hypothetical protein
MERIIEIINAYASRIGKIALLIIPVAAAIPAKAQLDVNWRNLVSRADITYNEPARRSEEGLPVGNGRMGSLVWTEPSALKLQINRVDLFAMNSSTVSFPRAHSDYGNACGYVDVNLVDFGKDVFTGKSFKQHLSVYDGLMTANGNGITAKVIAWPAKDVMAIEIDDKRPKPMVVNIDLRMLRYMIQTSDGKNTQLTKEHTVVIHTAEHTAASKLDIRNGAILLTQKFKEKDFYDASAVAIKVVGRASKARYLNESTLRLSVAPGDGRFTILISSAADFDPKKDIGGLAIDELAATSGKGFNVIQNETASWWHKFWPKSFVYMHSADGQADFVEQNYTYFQYLMGASSRGKYPPHFAGMLWLTNGDLHTWGSQYWWANTSAYYSNLIPSNRMELIQPLFNLYSGMYDACALAASQQWGSKGIWIPETVFFNGPEKLPDDIAAELKGLDLVQKPFDQHSAKFQWFAETKMRHDSRWNFQTEGKYEHGHLVVPTKGAGIFGHTTHIMDDATQIAKVYWQRYQATMDTAWLRDNAYPMIKGAAEFYRNFPNFKKEDDGKYHIHHVNNSEGSWNSSDTRYEVSAMHAIFPMVIRASEILGIDADMRPVWKEIKDNLVAIPPETRLRNEGDFGAFVNGGDGEIKPMGREPELKKHFLEFNRLGGFTDVPGIGGAEVFRNRLRLREGPGVPDAEHIGGLTAGIHSTMVSNIADSPADDPILEIFNLWPKDWDAAFSLLADGGFIVSSSQQKGKIEFVSIHSKCGQKCQLQNPWGNAVVFLYRDNKKSEKLSGELLSLTTKKGEDIVIIPDGSLAPVKKKIL